MALKALIALSIVFINIQAQILIANLVSLFVFAVLWQVLLYCVVGQMHASEVVAERILAGSCADVSIFVPVAFDYPVD